MLLMGKSTISTGPFSIAMFVYRRVPPNHPLVGGLEHDLIFPYIGNVITPTDELLFFHRGRAQPPTRSILPGFFHERNHPAIKGYHHLWKPPFN